MEGGVFRSGPLAPAEAVADKGPGRKRAGVEEDLHAPAAAPTVSGSVKLSFLPGWERNVSRASRKSSEHGASSTS